MIWRAFLMLILALPRPGLAQDAADMTRLDTDNPEAFAFFDDLGFYQFLHDSVAARSADAARIHQDVFPSVPLERWQAEIDRIYSLTGVVAAFEAAWDEADVSAEARGEIIALYGTDLGRRVVAQQIEMSRYLATAEGADAARAALAEAEAARNPRLAELEIYRAELNSVDRAVAAQLNRQISFWRGLIAGQGPAGTLSEDTILSALSADIEQRRAASEDWLRATHFMTFAPFTPEEITQIRAMNRSAPGRELLRAAHASYGRVFDETQYQLGLAAARLLNADDI
ncbi:MAG: hypothetical protein AAGA70_03980 [Pseudomonadota bacterium]